MKIFSLLSLLLISINVFSQADSLHEFDSLAKYSYLLIETVYRPASNEPPNLLNLKPVGYASGFFVRDSTKLLLFSAYHVFSSCEVYLNHRDNDIADYLVVRITDTQYVAKYVIIPIPLAYYAQLPCTGFIQQPDVAALDVTGWFQRDNIYSLEAIIKDTVSLKKIKKTKVFSYGYPVNEVHNYLSTSDYDDHVKPSLYVGDIDTNYHFEASLKQKFYSNYIITKPCRVPGVSGSPVFIEQISNKKKAIKFLGIQSGVSDSDHYNQCTIVNNKIFKSYFQNRK